MGLARSGTSSGSGATAGTRRRLTLFEVHEGTRVRVDQRTEAWAEIVLEDGKVGWVPAETIGAI